MKTKAAVMVVIALQQVHHPVRVPWGTSSSIDMITGETFHSTSWAWTCSCKGILVEPCDILALLQFHGLTEPFPTSKVDG